MSELNVSTLLAELIKASKEIGLKKNPPFTAERFLIAIVDKINAAKIDEDDFELAVVADLVRKYLGDLNLLKEAMMAYVCHEKTASFADDLYMKKRLNEATAFAAEVNVPNIDTAVLFLCIIKN